jgi:ATP-dependent DNA helicase RecG
VPPLGTGVHGEPLHRTKAEAISHAPRAGVVAFDVSPTCYLRGAMTAPGPTTSAPAARLAPDTFVQFLPGVGPRRAPLLGRLGIVTLEDLVRTVPRDYLDARRTVPVARLVPGQIATILVRVDATDVRSARGRSDLRARVSDASGALGVTWFGQGFLARSIAVGQTLALIGELAPGPGRTLANPLYEIIETPPAGEARSGAPDFKGRILPLYSLTAGISARALRQWIAAALAAIGEELAREDPLPAGLRARLALPDLAAACRAVHAPGTPEEAERGRRRLAFDELLLVQLVLALRRRARDESVGALVTARGVARARAVIAALPFEATAAQKRTVNEIVRDMKAPRPMHRLLVGDVGAGKTVVALLAAACAAEAGFQIAFMAPTEILAEQHFRTLSALGKAADLAPALWTGSTPESGRRELRRRLALPAGDPFALDLVVGTHALLEDDVPLPRLGLVVVDEQHRFGVRQRAQLAARRAVSPTSSS